MKITKDIDDYGNIRYYNEQGQLHREGGPAIEYANGHIEWFLNDKRHREDGPAIEWASGDKEWWINGKRHREDGPAVEWTSEYKEWYLNGKQITEQKFNNFILRKRLQRIINF